MYEGMITPLAPFQIRGALWYQGESNGERGFQYRALLPALITSWRDLWKSPDLPFLVIQLPNHGSSPELGDSAWAEVREAQLQTSSTVPHVGLIVTIDVGDPKNVHPARKHEVGGRAAEWALNAVYEDKTANLSPIFDSAQVKGNVIVARFKPTNSPLASRDGAALSPASPSPATTANFTALTPASSATPLEISSAEVPHSRRRALRLDGRPERQSLERRRPPRLSIPHRRLARPLAPQLAEKTPPPARDPAQTSPFQALPTKLLRQALSALFE